MQKHCTELAESDTLDGKQMSQEEFKFHRVQSRMLFLLYRVNTLCADNICVTVCLMIPSVLIYVYSTFYSHIRNHSTKKGSINEERKPGFNATAGMRHA